MGRRAKHWVSAGGMLALLLTATPLAGAQGQAEPTALALTPTADTAPAGSCNEFTARVTGEGVPVSGVTVDVRQILRDAGTEPDETQELAFCNPVNPNGPNPTGRGGTAFGDVSGNNEAGTAGLPGRHTDVHGEVGPTDANGEVTFGITISDEVGVSGEEVTVTAWFELEDDDALSEGEPSDTSTKTWVVSEDRPIVSLDAAPETAFVPNGGMHQVTVTMASGIGVPFGFVPSSVIVADATGRPGGDVADPAAGSSPNFGQAAYSCTGSDNQGVSTCTFQDPLGAGTGTDTVVFFVDEGQGPGLDANDVQDAVQVTWFQAETPPPTPTPTPPPTPTPTPVTPEARNIRLCHGTAATTACNVAQASRAGGDDHTVAALVTDRQGSPLAGVPVELRLTGVGSFRPGGASSVLVTTSSGGVAVATLSSEIDGTSSIVAEISPRGSAGSFRGPAANDDECEQPAGPGGVPPAGSCVSQMLQVTWTTTPTICSDGIDNDDDGLVDLEDPGCVSEHDDSELDAESPPPVPHERRINMRFRDRAPGDEGLVIFGRVRLLAAGDDFRRCKQAQPVRIQRRVDGDWRTIEHATTNARGRYAGVVFDRTGPYRAVAVRTELLIEGEALHVCHRVAIRKTHHHRR